MYKINETLESKTAFLTLKEDGIIRILFKAHSTIEAKDTEIHTDMLFEITNKIKHPCIFQAQEHVIFSKEARERSSELELITPLTCMAMVTKSLSYKLVGNFYIKFHKPKIPFKLFSTEELAIEWIKKNDLMSKK